jgi:hypothetical protein
MTTRLQSALFMSCVACVTMAACWKDAPPPAADGSGPLVASDTSARAHEVALTAAQACRTSA